MKLNFIILTAPVIALLMAGSLQARTNVEVVGSSTVYPFSTVVAERYGRASGETPKIEATGSGGGLKMFCNGIGTQYPDIANASRRIKKSEFDQCLSNGVTQIIEVQVGFDGIVLANSTESPAINLTRKDIFLALAKLVPESETGKLIENPYTTWNQVNATLPAVQIEVLGPPPTSGTRDAFAELAMEGGCNQIASIATLKKTDKNKYKAVCHSIREDGHYIEAGENDNLIIQKLAANPDAFGVFGFSFLDQNADLVQGAIIEGVAPEFDSIADKSYPVSRPLYFYVKKAHLTVIPGIRGYLREFTSEKAWGDEGYLTDKGLIPMPRTMRNEVARRVSTETVLTAEDIR